MMMISSSSSSSSLVPTRFCPNSSSSSSSRLVVLERRSSRGKANLRSRSRSSLDGSPSAYPPRQVAEVSRKEKEIAKGAGKERHFSEIPAEGTQAGRKRHSHGDSSQKKLLLERLHASLQDRHLLQPQQKVLVAVSGGQDSISLIYLLAELQSRWGWKLGIAHCDHQWSPSSRAQASHVSQIACKLGMDYYQAVATRDVSGEGSARSWRYGILQRIAISHGYSAIVTAHTASDRVETLLHNLFRGSGLHGLLSLNWKRWVSYAPCLSFRNAFTGEGIIESVEDPFHGRNVVIESRIALVRPLLDSSRMELRQLCELLELPLWPDPSNFSLHISRNRIRHQLLPFLRKNFQASVDKSLARWAEILHGEDLFLESLCQNIRMKAESPDGGGGQGKKLDTVLIRSLPIALQRRVIKQFVESFSKRSLGFDHVERLRVLFMVPGGKDAGPRNGLRISLPGDVELHFLDKEMILHSTNEQSTHI